MGKGKKHTPEQIVSLLRQIEVAVSNGKTTPIACREGGWAICQRTTSRYGEGLNRFTDCPKHCYQTITLQSWI